MTAPQGRKFAFARLFDAPSDRVWHAFTDVDALTQWWGPKGFAMKVASLDLRPGGVFHYAMTSPGGVEMWGKFVYRVVTAPERLEFVSSFCDAQGNILRHPASDTWPLEVLTVVTFTENEGSTVVALSGNAINATDEEVATFEGGRDSMQKGFSGTFDQLAEFLAKG